MLYCQLMQVARFKLKLPLPSYNLIITISCKPNIMRDEIQCGVVFGHLNLYTEMFVIKCFESYVTLRGINAYRIVRS